MRDGKALQMRRVTNSVRTSPRPLRSTTRVKRPGRALLHHVLGSSTRLVGGLIMAHATIRVCCCPGGAPPRPW